MSLLEAVHRVNFTRVTTLLSRGADVNMTDAHGVTPLIIACERGDLKMVDLLLEAKASTKMVTNSTQSSCLHIAAKNNAGDIVVRLLEVDPTIEERATSQGDTALMAACLSAVETQASATTLTALLRPSNGRGEVFLGPDDPRLRARNRHGHTALHCAALAQSPTAVRKLLEAGADCTVADKAGRTAIEVAVNLMGKKKKALREGARGAGEQAAEGLSLLRSRWAELESEAKEREQRLLGELDKGAGSPGDAGKGRRGAGNGASVSAGGKKSTRKKKKKQQQQQQQQQQCSTPTSEAGREGVDANGVGDAEQLASASTAAAAQQHGGAVGVPPPGIEVAMVGSAQAGPASANAGGGVGDSSDGEGQTDDEAGSHPSSEAETGFHEDAADEVEVAVETAEVVVAAAMAAVEEVRAKFPEATDDVVVSSSSPMNGDESEEDDEVSGGGGGGEGGGSWSVVSRTTRKKKAVPTPRRSSPPPPPPLPVPGQSAAHMRIRVRGSASLPRRGNGGRGVSSSAAPSLSRGARTTAANGHPANVAAASGSPWAAPAADTSVSAEAPTSTPAACHNAATLTTPCVPAAPKVESTATVGDGSVVTAPPPSTAVPLEASTPSPSAVPQATGGVTSVSPESGGGDQESAAVTRRRQLNVNANAWTPAPPTGFAPPQVQPPQVQPPLLPSRPLHMQMQMPMHGPPPVPFSGMPMGPGNGLHPPLQQPPLQQPPLPPLPPPAAWNHQPRYNNGFTGMRPAHTMHMHPAMDVNGGPGMMFSRPSQAAPQHMNGGMMRGGGGGGGAVAVSNVQAMLEASSAEAGALALRVEHLVWGVEAMRAGLSMGQLDTLKTLLLDQVSRVDEAKLEQVRVQERCKSEEKASILQQLHQFQADDSSVSTTIDSSDGDGGGDTNEAEAGVVVASSAGGSIGEEKAEEDEEEETRGGEEIKERRKEGEEDVGKGEEEEEEEETREFPAR